MKPPVYGGLGVGDTIRQGKGEFLDGSRTGLPDVIAANADGVPPRHLF